MTARTEHLRERGDVVAVTSEVKINLFLGGVFTQELFYANELMRAIKAKPNAAREFFKVNVCAAVDRAILQTIAELEKGKP